ncbi:MAG: PilZ domain-containing protein [Betaproteobacteria bacterium]|nr:PilZ domain-containing protein [Betaproteobacteria bacterium]
MKKAELRGEVRVAVSGRGKLNSGDSWNTCLLSDMSDNGFLLISTQEPEVGQVLDFRCELFPGQILECKVEVRHVSDAGVGTKITEIDEKGAKLCQLYLQEQYSSKLDRAI